MHRHAAQKAFPEKSPHIVCQAFEVPLSSAAMKNYRSTSAFLVGILALLGTGGCATQFFGDPYVMGGKAGCLKKCAGEGLEFGGMVYMGEYSSACICCPPGSGEKGVVTGAAAAAGGAAAGVMMQMQRSQEQTMAGR